MTTLIIIVLAIVYVLGIFVAYKKMKNWNNKTGEKVWFAVLWPLTAILYGIHVIHNME